VLEKPCRAGENLPSPEAIQLLLLMPFYFNSQIEKVSLWRLGEKTLNALSVWRENHRWKVRGRGKTYVKY